MPPHFGCAGARILRDRVIPAECTGFERAEHRLHASVFILDFSQQHPCARCLRAASRSARATSPAGVRRQRRARTRYPKCHDLAGSGGIDGVAFRIGCPGVITHDDGFAASAGSEKFKITSARSGRRERQLLECDRRRQQATVAANLMQGLARVEPQMVEAARSSRSATESDSGAAPPRAPATACH